MLGAMLRFVAAAEHVGVRLDRVLAQWGWLGSRAQVQGVLRRGQVRVGGVPRKASYLVRRGDVIEADGAVPTESVAGALPAPEALPLSILYEDADLLVIDKAAGVVVHPAPGHRGGTVVNALLYHLRASSQPTGLAGAPGRPGIVHRLDKDTTGVLVIAKTVAAHEALARQFHDRTVTKVYLALVRGRMAARAGVIDRPIGRHRRERKRMSVHSPRGRPSLTRYEVRDDFGLASVLHLFPATGRTHQLRVHLASIGHPIIGDRVYGRPRAREPRPAAGVGEALARFPRQALHAERIEFSHPRTGERVVVRAPLPEDVGALWTLLRRDRGRGTTRGRDVA
jgi:23S rRNA pseudouridine1911/1915/1917 synthase